MAMAFTLAGSLAVQAACPDYQTPQQAPAAPQPAKKSFRHFGSKLLSGLYAPWHMVHDSMVAAGQSATLVGKFDYDALLHKDLEDERVHVYLFGSNMREWEYLGSQLTDSDGKISLPLGPRPIGEYRVRMVVEGDGSAVEGFLSVVERGRDTILFDIDGTLTINDFEAYADYAGLKTAAAFYYAPQMVQAYQQKGYQIIYLTARPYWVTRDAREWFGKQHLLAWHYRSNPYADGPIPPNTEQHKTDYVRYLRDTVGLNIVRAYGNALTDIAAYGNGGIAKADTWIIGQHAGKSGTQAIGSDYAWHFSSVVASTPPAACQR
ncbi:haloacid dehalogenase [Chitinimonas arctica]|uniref:Haloacid dehalogenase n=2 Tax=Chitinimonas arctica TaxID=2594795 RepID=A0A516SMB6_9NEIS|nr:haloacid dehalogenase [Chitinimonas arctica]